MKLKSKIVFGTESRKRNTKNQFWGCALLKMIVSNNSNSTNSNSEMTYSFSLDLKHINIHDTHVSPS